MCDPLIETWSRTPEVQESCHGGTLYPRGLGPCSLPLDKGNVDSENEIAEESQKLKVRISGYRVACDKPHYKNEMGNLWTSGNCQAVSVVAAA